MGYCYAWQSCCCLTCCAVAMVMLLCNYLFKQQRSIAWFGMLSVGSAWQCLMQHMHHCALAPHHLHANPPCMEAPCIHLPTLCLLWGLGLTMQGFCVLWYIKLTGCGAAVAALSSHAGRHQRALPDKRARRKPGWLDSTIDLKTAAQMATQHTAGAGVSLCQLAPLGVIAHVITSSVVISTRHPSHQAKLSCLVGIEQP